MWCDSGNVINMEFIWHNVLVKGMSISIHNYKTILFPGLPFSDVSLLMSQIHSFSPPHHNVIRGFYFTIVQLQLKTVIYVASPSVDPKTFTYRSLYGIYI